MLYITARETYFTGTGNRSFCSLQRFFKILLMFNGDEDTDIEIVHILPSTFVAFFVL